MPPICEQGGAPMEAQARQLLSFVTRALASPIHNYSNLLRQSLVDCRFYLGHCISELPDKSRLRFHDQRGILLWCQFLCREVAKWMNWSPLSLVYHYDEVQSVLQRCVCRRPAWPELPDSIKIEQNDSSFAHLMDDLLTSVVSDQEILSLSKQHAQIVVDSLDFHLSPRPSSSFFRLLGRICKHHAILPFSFTLVEQVQKQGQFAHRHGGFADVWKGTYRGKIVAVKTLRLRTQRIDLLKSVCYEAAIWKYLSHSNIVNLLGVYEDPSGISLISPWMPHGSIMEFLRKVPRINRLSLLTDVARGLCYLHSLKLVHCDLRGANILVDEGGHARLVDFGLSGITHGNELYGGSTSFSRSGAVRWSAPELLFPGKYSMKHRTPTMASDMYALAMVMWEVLNGKCPFPKCLDPQDDWKVRPSAAYALEVLAAASHEFVAICYDLSDSEDDRDTASEESIGRTAREAPGAVVEQDGIVFTVSTWCSRRSWSCCADCITGYYEEVHLHQQNSAAMTNQLPDVQTHPLRTLRRTEPWRNRTSFTTTASTSSLFDGWHSDSSRTDVLSDQPDIFKDLPPVPPQRFPRLSVPISREVMRLNHIAAHIARTAPDNFVNKPSASGQPVPIFVSDVAHRGQARASSAVSRVVGTRRPTVSTKERQLRGQAYVYDDETLAPR